MIVVLRVLFTATCLLVPVAAFVACGGANAEVTAKSSSGLSLDASTDVAHDGGGSGGATDAGDPCSQCRADAVLGSNDYNQIEDRLQRCRGVRSALRPDDTSSAKCLDAEIEKLSHVVECSDCRSDVGASADTATIADRRDECRKLDTPETPVLRHACLVDKIDKLNHRIESQQRFEVGIAPLLRGSTDPKTFPSEVAAMLNVAVGLTRNFKLTGYFTYAQPFAQEDRPDVPPLGYTEFRGGQAFGGGIELAFPFHSDRSQGWSAWTGLNAGARLQPARIQGRGAFRDTVRLGREFNFLLGLDYALGNGVTLGFFANLLGVSISAERYGSQAFDEEGGATAFGGGLRATYGFSLFPAEKGKTR